MDTHTTSGQDLKRWRISRGWRQSELAERAGLIQQTISKAERSGRIPEDVDYILGALDAGIEPAEGFEERAVALLYAAGRVGAQPLSRRLRHHAPLQLVATSGRLTA